MTQTNSQNANSQNANSQNKRIANLIKLFSMNFIMITMIVMNFNNSFAKKTSNQKEITFGTQFYIRFTEEFYQNNLKDFERNQNGNTDKNSNNLQSFGNRKGQDGQADKIGFKLVRKIFSDKSKLSNHREKYDKLTNVKKYNQQQINRIYEAEKVLERTFVAELKIIANLPNYCKKLSNIYEFIEDAEPIYEYPIQKLANEDNIALTPNDPLIINQESLTQIKLLEAFDVSMGNSEIVIAISDNGVNHKHPDYYPNIKINTKDPINGLDDDENGYIDDYDGFNFNSLNTNSNFSDTYVGDSHGTNVAGIASAKTGNGIGIVGAGGLCSTFPMRTSANDFETVIFGYESIIYAGVRGFDVLNCSWGSKKGFSSIEQSFIEFADANGVFVVASGGNTSFSELDLDKIANFYPANYKNVFGVGEVDRYDYQTSFSRMGTQIDIMAPGYENYTLSIANGYSRASYGTSFSSPMVAGVVGVLKSQHKNLTNEQIANIIRITGDDITPLNQEYAPLLANRINVLNAINPEVVNLPAITFDKIIKKDNSGNIQQKFYAFDTLNLSFEIRNTLGVGKNLNFEVYPVFYNDEETIKIIKNKYFLDTISSYETKTIDGFSFYVNNFNTDKIIMRVDIIGDNDYYDFFLFDFYPNDEMITFENKHITMSISEKGLLGYVTVENNKYGKGLFVNNLSDAMYSGGLITCINSDLVSNSLKVGGTDFSALKPFKNPVNEAIITNSTSLTINKIVNIPKNDPFISFDLEVNNTAFEDLNEVAIGYYIDWDLGFGNAVTQNKISIINDKIPSQYKGVGSIQYCEDKNSKIFFGALVATEELNSTPQIANVGSSSRSNIIKALNNGINWQTDATGDIGGIFGIKFNGIFGKDDVKKCKVCISGADTKDKLITNLQNCLLNIYSSNNEEFDYANLNQNDNLIIYPNPISNESVIYIKEIVNMNNLQNDENFDIQNIIEVSIYDNLGSIIKNTQNTNEINLDDVIISKGSYNIVIKFRDNTLITKKLIKL